MIALASIVESIGEASVQQPASNAHYDVDHVSSIENANGRSIVFATTPETLQGALASSAGLVLTQAKFADATEDSRVFRVKDPRLAFSLLAARLRPEGAEGVHPSAVLHGAAKIGPGASIGPGCVIAAGVVLGPKCRLGARVVVEEGVVLGARVQVQSGAVLGSYGFGYARRPDRSYILFPQQGTLVIEDDVEIGANSTIDRGALGETRIGQGTKIDNLVHIGHNCRIGKNVILAAQTGISGSTVVEDGAILGGQVGIGEHATVGPDVILGGGAGVLSGKKLRGPGEVFWGRPAQPLKQYLRDMARLRRGR